MSRSRVIIFSLLVLAGASSCSSSPGIQSLTPDELDQQLLESTVNALGWENSPVEVRDGVDVTVHRASLLVMAGAEDAVEIWQYGSETESQLAFDTLVAGRPLTIHGLPAKSEQRLMFDESSQHFQGSHSIAWLNGERIFLVITGYNSTIKGAPRNPEPLSEVLYIEAMNLGLVPESP